jgi:hypothetical protein
MRAALKLLALLAVLLMPFGMVPAAAASHHAQMTSMPMQHCPEQGSKHDSKGAFAECTMACSAALPALDQSRPLSVPIVCERVRPSLAQQLSDLHPEIATPPPKRS